MPRAGGVARGVQVVAVDAAVANDLHLAERIAGCTEHADIERGARRQADHCLDLGPGQDVVRKPLEPELSVERLFSGTVTHRRDERPDAEETPARERQRFAHYFEKHDIEPVVGRQVNLAKMCAVGSDDIAVRRVPKCETGITQAIAALCDVVHVDVQVLRTQVEILCAVANRVTGTRELDKMQAPDALPGTCNHPLMRDGVGRD